MRILKFSIFCCSLFILAGCGKEWNLVRTQGQVKFVTIPAKHEADTHFYQKVIDDLCEPNKFCMIRFWPEGTNIPATGDVPDSVLESAIANYTRNMKSGYDKLMLSCKINNDRDNCF